MFCLHAYLDTTYMQCPRGPEQDVWSSGTGVTVGYPLVYVGNWPWVLLSTELSLQHPRSGVSYLRHRFALPSVYLPFPVWHLLKLGCREIRTCGKYSRITGGYFSSKYTHTPLPVEKAQTLEQLKLAFKARQGSFGYGTWGTCLTFLCCPSTGAIENRGAPVFPCAGLGWQTIITTPAFLSGDRVWNSGTSMAST